ncbi:MAG: hypothetical protein MUO72_09490 [Bacteroidales bacterium]|nr:hypothetical protein [Bacteroidales bacterium]
MSWGKNLYDLVRIPIKKVCNGYYLRWYYNGWHYWFFLPGKYTMVTEGEKYRTIGTRQIAMGTGQITRSQSDAIRTIMNTREVYLLTIAGWMNIRIDPGTINVYENEITGDEFEFIAIIGSKEITYSTGYSPVNIIPVVLPDVTFCEIIIGSQVWMCKNWDAKYPGSKVYNNDEANRTVYGGLYSYSQIKNPGFCPAGWHIPTLVEWQKMITFVGGDTVAGGILKERLFAHWSFPNTGAVADPFSFTARGGGWWGWFYGLGMGFYNIYTRAYFWVDSPAGYNNIYYLRNDSAAITLLTATPPTNSLYAPYASVRLIKDTPAPPIPLNDWFLPSLDELSAMRTELYLYGIGGFSTLTYWSSSESFAFSAKEVFFFDGTINDSVKGNLTVYTRACRFFTSTWVYNLRDIGPAGGYIFWKSGNDYLEAAPVDQSSNQRWSNISVLIGTTGTAIGTGQANTNAIIGQAGHIDSAAKLCDDYVN